MRLVLIFFFGTKLFWDWLRDFFRCQNFSRSVPRLFLVLIFLPDPGKPGVRSLGPDVRPSLRKRRFWDLTDETLADEDRFRYHQNKWRIPGTGMSHSDACIHTCIYKGLGGWKCARWQNSQYFGFNCVQVFCLGKRGYFDSKLRLEDVAICQV